jgi:hypothetical protein
METAVGQMTTVCAFYRGWRLMGLDSTVLDLPDTAANDRSFGRPSTGRAPGAFPQSRLLPLCELGTHAVCGAVLKSCRRNEQLMVPPLLDLLGPGMLLLWDRGFFGYDLARCVIQAGWRKRLGIEQLRSGGSMAKGGVQPGHTPPDDSC